MGEPSTEDLIAEQIPRLRRYARALISDPVKADDLVQDTLVRALSRSHLWQPGTDIRAWMFTILHNIHVNHQRQRYVRAEHQELVDDQPEMASPASQDHHLQVRDLGRALELLPEAQRQVVLLVGLEGMNYKKVAAVRPSSRYLLGQSCLACIADARPYAASWRMVLPPVPAET